MGLISAITSRNSQATPAAHIHSALSAQKMIYAMPMLVYSADKQITLHGKSHNESVNIVFVGMSFHIFVCSTSCAVQVIYSRIYIASRYQNLPQHGPDHIRVLCQEQVSRAGTSNYIPQYLWDIITCPYPQYLLLVQHSWYGPWTAVHPKKYTRGSWFIVFSMWFDSAHLPISFMITSLALGHTIAPVSEKHPWKYE